MAACRTCGPGDGFSACARAERGEPAADQEVVPAGPVLLQQQHRLAVGSSPRGETRGLDLHERHEAMHFRLGGRQLGEDAAETQRLLAQLRAHPVIARRRRVSLVENEVDDRQHRGQALGKLRPARDLERHALVGQRALGAHDALGDGRLRHQESARDLLGLETGDEPQGEGHLRLPAEQRMAGGEHQPQQVIANVVVERSVEVGHLRLAFRGQFVTQLGVLAVDQLGAAKAVERAMLGGGHQPGAGLVGDAGARPLLERGDEGILRQLLGHADVTHHARQTGDELCLLDAEDRLDGVMCIGSRHGYRYQHLQVAACKLWVDVAQRRPPTAGPRRRTALRIELSSSMSNFFICRKAFVTRCDFWASASASISGSTVGTTCQETPYLSFSQPQGPSSPPLPSLLQK